MESTTACIARRTKSSLMGALALVPSACDAGGSFLPDADQLNAAVLEEG